ncbi:atrophin-1-like [Anopheles bellator]|uniref:atrophin-1-like n=1 Tax=Anopheles bellator TaxID=139047 RepID=UPI0026479B7E|nr:atrophin-1-like [Anopheles bellator]
MSLSGSTSSAPSSLSSCPTPVTAPCTATAGMFSSDAASAFNSLTSSIVPSGSCLSGASGSSAYDKKTMSSCRYQQDKSAAALSDYFLPDESALVAAAAAAQHHLPHHHLQQQQQQQQISTTQQQQAASHAASNPLFSPHFGSAPPPYPSMQAGGAYETSSAARSCALPSPTIYPPTPPPSAPWIHPWYGGDTF